MTLDADMPLRLHDFLKQPEVMLAASSPLIYFTSAALQCTSTKHSVSAVQGRVEVGPAWHHVTSTSHD